MQRLAPESTLVAVIDVQERLAPAMPAARMADLTRGVGILLEAARLMRSPVLATEQYPKGLGTTLPDLAAKLDALGVQRIEKTDFSACDAPEFARTLAALAPSAVIVTGMETHVCVYQTVRDLTRRGVGVYVAVDAVCSRRDDHRDIGLSLCERAGAVLTTTETIVFDWLRRAGSDEFKALSKLIR